MRLAGGKARAGLRVEPYDFLPPQISHGFHKLKSLGINHFDLSRKARWLQYLYLLRTNADFV